MEVEEECAAPFLSKTYAIVDDPSTHFIVSWTPGNNSFLVKDPHHFSLRLLPLYFKHSNFSSFVRQLNTYGFRKVDPDRWEFAHERFLRGERELLKSITRRRAPLKFHQILSSNSHALIASEVSCSCDLEGNLENLKQEEDTIVKEVVLLRKEQASNVREMEDMKKRLDLTERITQQMMSFLGTVIDCPILRVVKKRKLLPHMEFDYQAEKQSNWVMDGLTGNADELEYSPLDMPLFDSDTSAAMLSKELASALPLKGNPQNAQNCSQRSQLEIDLGFSDDEQGLSNQDGRLWGS